MFVLLRDSTGGHIHAVRPDRVMLVEGPPNGPTTVTLEQGARFRSLLPPEDVVAALNGKKPSAPARLNNKKRKNPQPASG